MSTRAETIATIKATIEQLTGIPVDKLADDQVLLGFVSIDSLDLVEIRMALEEEFGLDEIEELPDWTVGKIADAVAEQLGRQQSYRA